MEVSAYNFFTKRGDDFVVYNAAAGTFTKISMEVWRALKKKTLPEISESHLEILRQAGVIHDGRQHETIRAHFDLNRFAGQSVNITIAPTIECNLACWYCYQNERRYLGKMDERTQDATIEFIAAATAGRKSFHVDWYGGEPLLARDLIESMTNRLARRFADGEPKYTGGHIITNGLLLDDETVAMLLRAGIGSAQISFDRLLYKAPRQRGLLMSDGTVGPILANVIKFRDRLSFSIRINLTAIEPDELHEIERVLHEHGLRDIAYVARAEDNLAECTTPIKGFVAQGNLSRKAFARSKAEFGRGTPMWLAHMQRSLTPSHGFCGATNGGLYVVDFRGDVSRCFLSAGVAGEKIGNVHDLTLASDGEQNPTEQSWRRYTPFDYASCEKCRVLPLCMGGCSHARVLHNAVQPPCEDIKFNVNRYVKEIAALIPERS